MLKFVTQCFAPVKCALRPFSRMSREPFRRFAPPFLVRAQRLNSCGEGGGGGGPTNPFSQSTLSAREMWSYILLLLEQILEHYQGWFLYSVLSHRFLSTHLPSWRNALWCLSPFTEDDAVLALALAPAFPNCNISARNERRRIRGRMRVVKG